MIMIFFLVGIDITVNKRADVDGHWSKFIEVELPEDRRNT